MNEPAPSFRLASIFHDETVPIEGGTMQWIPLRRRLGIEGFGTNAYRAARVGDREMYVVVSGGAKFEIDGEEVGSPFVRFRLACCLAEMGQHERALEELREAIETKPEILAAAEKEEHLSSLRGLDGWPGT